MEISFKCEMCGQVLVVEETAAGSLVECPKCSTSIVVPGSLVEQPSDDGVANTTPIPHPIPSRPVQPKKFEYAVCVLQFEKETFAWTRADILQGLSEKSALQLASLGNNGWELVSVIPFTAGGASAMTWATTGTNAALAFLKRTK